MGTSLRSSRRAWSALAATAGLLVGMVTLAGTSQATTVPPGTDAWAAPVPSPGCGTSTVGPSREVRHTLQINGVERWFLLTTPPAHDGHTPIPLVLDFHGLGEGASIHTLMSGFSPIAEAHGFAVAFPQGQFDPVRWDVSASSNPNNDLTFVDAILDTLGNELCLDTARVYAAGLSFGAFMTSFLMCERPDRFAAFAPVAGVQAPPNCPQDRPLPLLTFHGTADPILFFNGGFGQLPFLDAPAGGGAPAGVDLDGAGYPANVRTWAQRNGCNPDKTDTPVSAEVIHRVYDCPYGADVEFYIVLGGGHAWPGSEFSRAIAAVVGYTTFDIDASELAWSFFTRFRLPCSPDPTCPDPPASTSSTLGATPSSSSSTSTTTGAPAANDPTSRVSPAAAAAVTPRFAG